MIEKLYNNHRQLFLYAAFGVVTSVVSWSTYIACTFVLDAITSNIISWLLKVATSFVTGKLWVFRNKSHRVRIIVKQLILFYSSRIATGVIEIFLFTLLMSTRLATPILGIEGIAAKMAVSVLIIILNYLFTRIMVFTADY